MGKSRIYIYVGYSLKKSAKKKTPPVIFSGLQKSMLELSS